MLQKILLQEAVIENPEAMISLGEKVAELLKAGDLVVLIGSLGAGKTTFSRGVGKALKVIGNMSSPTFVISRTHRCEGSTVPLVHADAYRLSSAAELDEIDIPFDQAIVLVEWGKGLTDGISSNWLEIAISRDNDLESDSRTVTIVGFGSRWQEAEL